MAEFKAMPRPIEYVAIAEQGMGMQSVHVHARLVMGQKTA
jgi:hypothetical protein